MTVFNSPSFDSHELVAFKEDARSGLRAIIAVHNTALGPALGGCRFYPYGSDEQALEDVLRLSRGMSYKSALAGLPLGGGKAVIIGDPASQKSRQLLLAMGEFIEGLNGQYITAEDSGTGVADMKVIGERTTYVSGVMDGSRFGGDPSPYTAQGVFCGIKAACAFRHKANSLKGVRVAIQGAGSVGRHLTALLVAAGAEVFIADINAANLELAQALGAKTVAVADVLSMDADVLAPCAMGAVIDEQTVGVIKAGIVAGAANNQLAQVIQGEQLRQRGILYAPDFVINAGGIIDVYYQRAEGSSEKSTAHVETIADTLQRIFRRAEHTGETTARVAELLAEERFLAPVKIAAA
ncbi:MAG: leucine dehydrogenase [Zhongshania aliphaticivorans]|jgi:leucine dehydrogenase